MSKQWLEVGWFWSPLQPAAGGQVGGIPSQVEGASQVEVSVLRVEGKGKGKKLVTAAGGDGVEEGGEGSSGAGDGAGARAQ